MKLKTNQESATIVYVFQRWWGCKANNQMNVVSNEGGSFLRSRLKNVKIFIRSEKKFKILPDLGDLVHGGTATFGCVN